MKERKSHNSRSTNQSDNKRENRKRRTHLKNIKNQVTFPASNFSNPFASVQTKLKKVRIRLRVRQSDKRYVLREVRLGARACLERDG